MDTVRWSSISLASFRASSIGWTCVRNARPKTPSKRPSIFDSIVRNTLMWTGYTPPRRLASDSGGERPCDPPDERHEQDPDDCCSRRDCSEQERGPHREDTVAPVPAGEWEDGGGERGEERTDDEERLRGDGVGERDGGLRRRVERSQPERLRRLAGQRERRPRDTREE